MPTTHSLNLRVLSSNEEVSSKDVTTLCFQYAVNKQSDIFSHNGVFSSTVTFWSCRAILHYYV